jgi:hypothetical protein
MAIKFVASISPESTRKLSSPKALLIGNQELS